VNEDKASRYQRLKRYVAVVALVWGAALLAALLWTGLTLPLRDLAERLAPGAAGSGLNWTFGVLAYVALLSLLYELLTFPMSIYSGFLLERRYGLSAQRLPAWLLDQVKAFGITLVLGGGATLLVYALIARFPERWWFGAGLIFSLIVIGLANVAPVMLLPLFYSVKPLDRESLRARLLALAERAGARVLGAYEWGLAEKTRKANAALVGLGGTRRILVSDTMLAEYSEDEIEVVLAHELAHHVHGDIWKSILFEAGLIMAGFFAASRVLAAGWQTIGLRSAADVAGLPLLLLAVGGISLIMQPAAHAMSRAFERSADRFAIGLTRNPGAFISAMRRLGANNLAEENPSTLVRWLFYSHPPMRERIDAAQAVRSAQAVGSADL
jgi:STE24 endopeptidase